MREPLSAEGGVLYTWGGDFTWVEPAAVRAWAAQLPLAAEGLDSAAEGQGAMGRKASLPGIQRDTAGGCLGLGDRAGRRTPCRVGGHMERHTVTQVSRA